MLRHRDLAELSPAEREHLRKLLALLRPDPRRGRRDACGRPGTARPTPAAPCARHCATAARCAALLRRDKSRRPRKIVLLVDVSGSMEPYADALLRFAHVVTRRSPAAVETFTLGTRLTRVTRELRMRDTDHALHAAGKAIPDWSGGTRLGEVLRAFIDRWGQRGAARRAVVVVFSDGWERGEPVLLGDQMARLRRLDPQDHLGEPARREGRLRAGAGRNSCGAAVLGRAVGRAQPRYAGGATEGDAGCVT